MMRENSPPQLVAASLALGTKQFPAEWDGGGREVRVKMKAFYFFPAEKEQIRWGGSGECRCQAVVRSEKVSALPSQGCNMVAF